MEKRKAAYQGIFDTFGEEEVFKNNHLQDGIPVPGGLEPHFMNDPHDLNRFLLAQQDDHERALAEVKNGRKRTHWMW